MASDTVDVVVVNPARYTIQAGRFSRFAGFQSKLQTALRECGLPDSSIVPSGGSPDGRLGEAVRIGIEKVAACGKIPDLPATSAARTGALTEAVWRALAGADPIPTVEERTRALILSFEATDFGDAPEWNFCQDGTRARFGPSHRGRGAFQCFNDSDPCSFLTWGPRGATAGSGREIQHILAMVLRRDPSLLKQAFGREFPDVLRFLRLRGGGVDGCDGSSPLKQFVCAVWLDGSRRPVWESALASLGHSDVVREAYHELYAYWEFDGAKLEAYNRLWEQIGLKASQVDYAFFMDRITHFGGPAEDGGKFLANLTTCVGRDSRSLTPNAGARRCVSRLQPHPTQPDLRLARDVAFFLDGYPEGALSRKEIETWGAYIPLSAMFNFGLSDAVPHPIEKSVSITSLKEGVPAADSAELTATEATACPPTVLTPLRRRSTR